MLIYADAAERMKAMQEDYFIGLDVGTDSVGWAASDTNYNLLKCNQKALWGVRLFDEAHSACLLYTSQPIFYVSFVPAFNI